MKMNYEYTTQAIVIKKEVANLKITIIGELSKNVKEGEALDMVLDVLLDMAEQMPICNDNTDD